MRIAYVHSFYSSRKPSGENEVVRSEVLALRRAGHIVRIFAASMDEAEQERMFKLRSALRVASDRGRGPLEQLNDWDPDVVHVHNLFPLIARSNVTGIAAPVVHTLHNYRPLCSAATLLRDGSVCTLCPDHGPWHAVRYRCFQDSRLATLPVAISQLGGLARDPLLRRADRIIVLSSRMEDVYVSHGLPAERVIRWPNFLPESLDPGRLGDEPARAGLLFVGRLDREKGILELAQQWHNSAPPLTIVGEGPDASSISRLGKANVRLVGSVPRSDVLRLMRRSAALVFPSRWFEGFPLVYPEALAANLPVLATLPSSVAGFVGEDDVGLAFESPEELASWAARDRDITLATIAARPPREVFEERYTEAAYVRRATELYSTLSHRYRQGGDALTRQELSGN